jgi:hypothetical protein
MDEEIYRVNIAITSMATFTQEYKKFGNMDIKMLGKAVVNLKVTDQELS